MFVPHTWFNMQGNKISHKVTQIAAFYHEGHVDPHNFKLGSIKKKECTVIEAPKQVRQK